jgi:exodeoxyribonuclease VII small subunit
MTTDSPDEEERFEDRLARLEDLVEDLESGDLPLGEAFEAFEEGVELADDLQEELEEVEARVDELLEDGSEVPRDADDPGP